MDKLKKNAVLLIGLMILLLRFSTLLFAYEGRSTELFNVYFSEGSSLAFQNDNKFVWISPTVGDMNSSEASCRLYDGGGWFKFVSNESVSLKIDFNVSRVQLNRITIESGASESFVKGDSVLINWDITIKPLLPMMFMFGMIGLLASFGGPLYMIQGIKKHGLNQDDLKVGIIVTAIGISLVLAWLW